MVNEFRMILDRVGQLAESDSVLAITAGAIVIGVVKAQKAYRGVLIFR